MNLFKKLKAKVSEIKSVAVSDNTIGIDEQIYNDVYSAQELLLQEAKKVLEDSPVYDQKRYDRLKKLASLGFQNAQEVHEFELLESKKKHLEELRERIEYYKRQYSLHKFIDEKSVIAICKKYALYLTKAHNYIAEIPEKNQNEIVAFKVKRKDVRTPYEVGGFNMLLNNHLGMLRWSAILDKDYNPMEEMIDGQDLLIIAPEEKIDTYGLVKHGHKLMINDPIVLQPVQGGYLIVSSWGLEAGDPLVINPINN